MNELRLRFSDGDQPDLVLGAGVHALGRRPDGLGPVDAEQPWLLQLCNDRRGIWLTVADDLRGVHVNGRPVQHVAMLRAGDSIHVDGNELLLTAANDGRALSPANSTARDSIGNLRLALAIKRLGLPCVVALNMNDLAKERGIRIDADALSAELGGRFRPRSYCWVCGPWCSQKLKS